MNLMNYSRFIGAIEGSTGTLMQIEIGFSPLIRIWKCFYFEESCTDKGIFVTRDANLVSKMCQKSIFHDSIARARHAVLNYISYVHCPIVFTLKCTDVHIKPGLSTLLWTVWLFPMSNNGRSIITL